MPSDTGVTRFLGLAMLFTLVGLIFVNYLNSLAQSDAPPPPSSRSQQMRRLRKVTLHVPESCVVGFRQFAEELRDREQAGSTEVAPR
jgi:hypothetical protein